MARALLQLQALALDPNNVSTGTALAHLHGVSTFFVEEKEKERRQLASPLYVLSKAAHGGPSACVSE
jgi:hypothetical protein